MQNRIIVDVGSTGRARWPVLATLDTLLRMPFGYSWMVRSRNFHSSPNLHKW
jgi:hypothetical protein